MKKNKIILILVNLVILLGFFHYSMVQKERILDKGTLVLLRLAPVDPRSLMQGDYMNLRYEIATPAEIERSAGIDPDKIPARGYYVVTLDSGIIARCVRLQTTRQPLQTGEHLIEYTAKEYWNIRIGAESFFFEEGKADKYAQAKFGGLRIDEKGHSVLVGLYNEQRRLLQ